MTSRTIAGFEVRLDLAYDLSTHMWVDVCAPDRVRIGMDPLGIETAGTLAQLQFGEPGSSLTRGSAIGSLEAEKFVGPLVSPLSGRVLAVNSEAMESPSLVEKEPYGEGWMIELSPSSLTGDLKQLTQGAEAVVAEFEAKVSEYRRDGVLAE
jgi:glycine cleavage system H protein